MKKLIKTAQIIILLLLTCISYTPGSFAALPEEFEDTYRNSPWIGVDGESCLSPSPTGTSGGPDSAATNLVAETIFRFYVAAGLTKEQSAGIVGNAYAESTYNPDNINPKSGAYGTFQWLGDRLRGGGNYIGIEPYAASKGKPRSDLETQLNYAITELNGPENKTLVELRKQTTAYDSAVTWSVEFERANSSQENNDLRGNEANRILELYGNAEPTPGSVLTPYEVLGATPSSGGPGGGGSTPCSESTIIAGDAVIDTSKKDTYTGTEIDPTGIVLHWTGGDSDRSVDQFISDIGSNTACGPQGCSVQFYVKGDGTIYQLVDPINTLTSHAAGANSCCIGIEIGGVGAEDLLSNEPQKQAVVNLVTYLVETFSIQVDPDAPNLSGIISHHITPDGVDRKPDVGDEYHQQIVASVRNSQTDDSTTEEPVEDQSGGSPE